MRTAIWAIMMFLELIVFKLYDPKPAAAILIIVIVGIAGGMLFVDWTKSVGRAR